MHKKLSLLAFSLIIALTLSIIAPVQSIKFLAVDTVSAATNDGSTGATQSGNTTPQKPSTPATPSKPSTKPSTKPAQTPTTSKNTTPVTTTSSATGIKRLLTLGSRGEDVKLLQTLLNQHGYNLKVDGIFGPKTLAAVKDFQKKNGLKVDGIVGPKTLAKLAPATSGATSIKRLLVLGSRGEDVKVLQTLLNQHGYNLKVDGIFGPKTLAAVKDFQKKNGLKVDGIVGPQTLAKLTAQQTQKVAVKIGKVDYAAHGTKCFTVAIAAVAGDKIVAAYIDDYQFMSKDTAKGVPNSDQEFGTYFKEGYVLASKLENAAQYSNNMKTRGGATQTIDQNFAAVVNYVKNKTISELESILANTSEEAMVDVVTGSTLEDTYGYVKAIVEAAKKAKAASDSNAILVDEKDLANIKIGKVDYAAHGTKCFTLAAAAVLGDKIVAAYIDDYQFMSKDTAKGVPNSDQEFGTYFKEGYVLASKLENAAQYSNNMKTRGGATKTIDQNFAAIINYVKGKTISELESILNNTSKEAMVEKVEAVTGATLEDTYGYVKAIVEAAKAAKGIKTSGSSVVVDRVPVKIGKVDYAAHGDRSFTVAIAAVAGDKIVAAYIDEYQFMNVADGAKGVPNSDSPNFGGNFPEGKVLASKMENAALYSKRMIEERGATKTIDQNFAAIVNYVKGKTISQLESILTEYENAREKIVDVVTGATLADTYGYVKAIVEAAKKAQAASDSYAFLVDEKDLLNIKIGKVDYAAHGNRCFTIAAAAVLGDKIVTAYIDDYQLMDIAAGAKGVPNSDSPNFGGNFPEGKVLASKMENAALYSKNMKEGAGATKTIDQNFAGIVEYVKGKTISELESILNNTSKEAMVDVVTGATLVDTHGYVSAIVAAARAAK